MGRLGQGQLGQLERDIREDAPLLSWFVLERIFAPKKAKSGLCKRNRNSVPYSYRTAELNAGLPIWHRTDVLPHPETDCQSGLSFPPRSCQ